ncbi:DUF6223 family protein [Catellatospora vulcania]|uniref:DUF6223 family protein n=1 Tax=Catellatospora vulcania TaxID=1460450 RepID=UPI0012D483AC|nr:DUF6223 family protein [Catellatospora vulcania]
MRSSAARKSARLVLALTAAAALGGFGLAAPAAAHLATEPSAVDAYTLTTGRLVGTVGALAALAGAIIGGLSLARPASRIGTGSGSVGAFTALVAGLLGLAVGGLVVASAKGGPGTGYGIVGGYAALAAGLIAVVLGGLALIRSRRAG